MLLPEFAAYAPLDPSAARPVDWVYLWDVAQSLGFFTNPTTPGRLTLAALAVRNAWRHHA